MRKFSAPLVTLGFALLALPPELVTAAPANGLPAPRTPLDYLSRPAPAPPRGRSAPHKAVPPGLVVAPTAHWTYLVYMDGDNDLEEYITSDLETELAAQGSNAEVNVVALADRSPDYDTSDGNWTDTRLFHVTQNLKATAGSALSSWGERNMGDPQTLVDFIQYAKTWYPAEHYALVFWDHGWSWRPGQTMLDETDNDHLDLDEVASALQQTGPIDVVGYDACLMATVEVMSTFRPYSSAVVLSEDYVGYEGFRHDDVIAALRANPTMDAEAMAVAMADSMRDRTITAVALNQDWDVLQQAIDQWAVALTNGLSRYRSAYDAARTATPDFGDKSSKDIYQLSLEIQARVSDPAIQSTGQALRNAYDRVLLSEWHVDVYRAAYGTTIFWPKTRRDLDATSSTVNDWDWYRKSLSFSRQTHWDEFLSAYLQG